MSKQSLNAVAQSCLLALGVVIQKSIFHFINTVIPKVNFSEIA